MDVDTSFTAGGLDNNAHTDGVHERVEDTEERPRVVARPVLVDRYEHILVANYLADLEHGRVEIRDSAEGVV